MRFNHGLYGFKAGNLFKGDEEVEPHCSLVLKLNGITMIDPETIELVGVNPVESSIELLEDLKKSCEMLIDELRQVQIDI